ncbi:PREDICTED: disease resistance RPP13-like protein 4 [Nelumbo nucifera]|uniref:Disease resistance RPP13-like protein 4 n=1 Tax=Nelumbo nucifera TaxID=4432 RepID=A0A1U7ZXE2_NELNU|nr:PREDICTED: disease resistance RPP13-like protein 4 [Nelumbo nucifera]
MEIQGIKTRVREIFERSQRYRLNTLEVGSSSIATNHNTWHNPREDSLLLEEAELVGTNKPKRKLIGWLVEENPKKFAVVSVIGMGGLGKTTIVKKVYNDESVQGYFRHRAWLNISQSFKVGDLLRSMIEKLFKASEQSIPQEMEKMNDTDLKKILKEFLLEKTYLIVLDDMWNIDAWEALKLALPRRNLGNRIIITTRFMNIASSFKEFIGHVHHLKPLGSEDAWALFCIKVFPLESDCPHTWRIFLRRSWEDAKVNCVRLIRLWVAKGFIKEKGGLTMEETTQNYFKELINRCLVQIADTHSDGTMKKCKIHDLMRDIIILKAREAYFAGSLNHVPLEIFPDEIVNLLHLKYLSLRGTNIKMIPESIGRLRNLETLDLKKTYVTKLPKYILKLQQLRHILIYRYQVESYLPFDSAQLVTVPTGIGGLVALQKLAYLDASHGKGIIRELGRLTQLRRLGIRRLRKEYGLGLCDSIAKMDHLLSFDVSLRDEDEILDLQLLPSPSKLLERLYLKGRLEKLLTWIPLLDNLVKICLRWSRLKNDLTDALQALPNLVIFVFLKLMREKDYGFH